MATPPHRLPQLRPLQRLHPLHPLPAQTPHQDPLAPLAPSPTARPEPPVRYASTALFCGALEVHIEHESQLYRLRRTSLGKLILTK